MSEVYLNGVFVPTEQARVSVMDRGFLFGDGVYEVIPSYGGRFLGLEAHLDRLDDGLSAIRLDNPLTREQWQELLARLIAPPPAPDAQSDSDRAPDDIPDRSVYLQVTRGAPPERDHLCPESFPPTVFAMARPIKPRRPEVGRLGVACITRPDIRWYRCEIKSLSLLAAVMMRREAEDEGAMEAILLRDGMVTEGAVSNVFVVAGGEVLTPPKGHLILPGITRELVIRLAGEAGIRVLERRIPVEEMVGADEIWLTSSTREVLPVARLDGAPVGAGAPGPLWRQIDGLYQAYKAQVRAGYV
jgi:D-alanine transaminase